MLEKAESVAGIRRKEQWIQIGTQDARANGQETMQMAGAGDTKDDRCSSSTQNKEGARSGHVAWTSPRGEIKSTGSRALDTPPYLCLVRSFPLFCLLSLFAGSLLGHADPGDWTRPALEGKRNEEVLVRFGECMMKKQQKKRLTKKKKKRTPAGSSALRALLPDEAETSMRQAHQGMAM